MSGSGPDHANCVAGQLRLEGGYDLLAAYNRTAPYLRVLQVLRGSRGP